MTACHSSRLMLKMKRSRTMPALLTMQSMRPKLSSAACTILWAESHSATLSIAATAWPPASRISATTPSASALPVSLSRARSLTTTFAPCAANAFAKSRPMPAPAPVTTTTLSLAIAIACSLVLEFSCRSQRDALFAAELRIAFGAERAHGLRVIARVVRQHFVGGAGLQHGGGDLLQSDVD